MKSTIKFLSLCLFVVTMSLSIGGCDKNKPTPPTPPGPVVPPNPTPEPTPEPEIPKATASWPTKVELLMAEGHMHGSLFHANPHSKDFPFKKIQRMTLELKGDKYERTDGEDVFRLSGGAVWCIIANLFDKNGNRINTQFLTKENEKLCQMFISTSNVKNFKTGASLNISSGVPLAPFGYRDTDPEDKLLQRKSDAVKLTHSNVGLKGYFVDLQASADPTEENRGGGIIREYLSFNLNLSFVKFATPEEKTSGGSVRPGLDIEGPRKAKEYLFYLSVPTKILVMRPWNDAQESQYIKDIAEEYGLDEEKVAEAWEEYGDIDIESNNFYV